MKTEIIIEAQATLGEGPSWDEKNGVLYWVDILEKKVYADGQVLAVLDDYVGCAAACRSGHLVLGKRFSIADLDPATGKVETLARIDEPADNRFNDGKCDPAGRLLVGSMDMNEKDASGALYSFDGRTTTRLLGGLRISNGLAWSPDYKTFYHIDTPAREVKAFDYDPQSGAIANPRTVIRVPDGLGWPDGMTSDTRGHLWIAMWDGAQLTRWDPASGSLLERIPVPALRTTACAFGGPDRSELYVTSARVGLGAADLQKYPLSGGLFKLTTEIEGMPAHPFGPAS